MRIIRVAPLVIVIACSADDAPLQPDAGASHCEVNGALANQTLAHGDGVEDRTYYLYVPTDYRCDELIALLVDFHGTAGDPAPEEAYASQDFIALAEEKRAIVVRPRSRSYTWNGGNLYQWDGHPGDIERNETFARNLVNNLASRFPIDPARVYATGFSSGANMAAQFLGDPASPFRGLAPIAGGDWTRRAAPTITAPTRLYAATGYHDYLWPYARQTADFARRAGLAEDRIFVRRSGGGHEIHGWQLEEMWRFLDAGERPALGTLDAAWAKEVLPDGADVNAFAMDGTSLVAAGAEGHVWRHGTEWTVERQRPGADYATLCFSANRSFVGGMSTSAQRTNGTWTDLAALPDYGGMLGAGWINGADCRADGSIVVGGYWSQAVSTDGGATWSRFTATTSYDFEAQVSAVATSTTGATVLVGNYFIGRAVGGTNSATSVATPEGWLNAVTSAGTRFWAVGDHGQVWASTDDGVTWSEQTSGTREDLYGVSFVDAQRGAAVGRSGTVLVTSDGGVSWRTRPLGLTTTLAAVRIDGSTLWVGGQDGLIAKTPF